VRGGVGASTLAQNLAWSLSRKGSETIHLDLDLNFGSSALAFDIDGRQTALDALAHPDRLDDVMLDRCLVRRGDRLRVLTSPGDCSSPEPVRLESVSALFDVARAMADVVVVDLPHLWSDWVVFSLASADEVLMAATPDLACLRNAKAAFESLSPKRRGRAEARIVLNRANTSKRSDIVAEDFAEAVGTRPTICIPSEPDVFLEAANEGRMLGETKAGDPAAQLIDRLADEIRGVAAASGASASGSWLSRLFPGKTAKRPRPGRLFAKGAKKEAAP